jgi:hypothetical protein
VEPNPVFLFEGYRLVVLVVVVSLTELGSNDAVADEVVEVSHLFGVERGYQGQ